MALSCDWQGSMRSIISAASAALLLGACTGNEQLSITGTVDEPLPANYRELARAHLRSTLFDPYSVRDAMIAAPKNGGSGLYPGWAVCVRMNAKNRLGAYTGQSVTAVIMREGRVVHSVDETGWMFCQGVEYEPFPELEGA